LICPSVETFGIAMCEALACGKPVIAPRRGGSLEIVRDRETGLLLDRVDPYSVAEAVRAVAGRRFDAQACRESVQRFDERRFAARIDGILAAERAHAGATGCTRAQPAAELG
jgi:glycosyltransferase involved in cell wall biosynthesis